MAGKWTEDIERFGDPEDAEALLKLMLAESRERGTLMPPPPRAASARERWRAAVPIVASMVASVLVTVGVMSFVQGPSRHQYVQVREPGGWLGLATDGSITGDSRIFDQEEVTTYADILEHGRLSVTSLPESLRPQEATMGASPFLLPVSPVETMVVSTRPELSWQEIAEADAYDVRVYDPAISLDESIAGAESLKETTWKCDIELVRGNVYFWRVDGIGVTERFTLPGKEGPRFQVASDGLVKEIADLKAKYESTSLLLLAQGYADRHLYDAAAAALLQAQHLNEYSPLIEQLILQLDRTRRAARFRFDSDQER